MAQTFDQFLKEAKIGSQWFVHDDTDLEAYKRVVQIDKEPKNDPEDFGIIIRSLVFGTNIDGLVYIEMEDDGEVARQFYFI